MDNYCTTSVCNFFDSLAILWIDAVGVVGGSAVNLGVTLPWFWPVAAAVVGAILASLTGVVVDRLPRMQGWNGAADHSISLSHPSSHCDHCKKPLDPVSLIPVIGWVANKGRCGRCDGQVSPAYPAIEAGSALASLASVAVLGPSWSALAFCICLWTLILASWIDWKEQEIPDFITVPLLFLGLAASPFDPDMASRLGGAVIAATFVMLAFRLTGSLKKVDAMSYGDVALAGACGAWLGVCGAPLLLLGASATYIAYAIPFRARGVLWVPMGPAISLTMLVLALFGLRLP